MSADGFARTEDTSRDAAAAVRVVVRPVGSALPFGLMSFSVGMLLLAALDGGWIAATQGKQVGLLLVAFVFQLELLASVFAFLARDTLGGTVLGFFAGSWVALGLLQLASAPGAQSPAVGFYLFVFAAAAFLLAAAGALGKPLVSVLLALSGARAVLSGLHELDHGAGVQHASGLVAAAICGVGLYAGIAFLLEDLRGSPLLPVLRRGAARESFEGDLSEQLRRAGGEAGVRQQL